MEHIWQKKSVIAQTQIIAHSLRHWTGRSLLPGTFSAETLAEKVFIAPFVLVSHGMGADPVLNYGNATALQLWEMDWKDFTHTASRFTAEVPDQTERARLLARVTADGFVDDYSGIRISKTGRRFRIAQATVWNLVTSEGNYCGQAACFSHWEFV